MGRGGGNGSGELRRFTVRLLILCCTSIGTPTRNNQLIMCAKGSEPYYAYDAATLGHP